MLSTSLPQVLLIWAGSFLLLRRAESKALTFEKSGPKSTCQSVSLLPEESKPLSPCPHSHVSRETWILRIPMSICPEHVTEPGLTCFFRLSEEKQPVLRPRLRTLAGPRLRVSQIQHLLQYKQTPQLGRHTGQTCRHGPIQTETLEHRVFPSPTQTRGPSFLLSLNKHCSEN